LPEDRRCIKCSNKAVYYRAYSGTQLCSSCFCSSIEDKVKRTISKYNLLKHGDTIGVAISGGKDSLSLLRILNDICRHHASKIFAITIDEGILGYCDESLKICNKFSEEFGVPHSILSFKEVYGFDLDKAIHLRGVRKISACSICGILRRRAIDIVANTLKVDVIATAHNLDDLLQTFTINLLNGDISKIRWFDPSIKPKSELVIKRIKPLMEIYEKEIAMYAFLKDIPFQNTNCPYMNEGMRSEIRYIFNTLEAEHPGIKYSALNSTIKISQNIAIDNKAFNLCKLCNIPSSSKLCSVCKIVEMFEVDMHI